MDEDMVFQNYLVVFFDILGQKEALKKIGEIPSSELEKQKFLESIRESIGVVLKLRGAFNAFFKATLDSHSTNENLVAPKHRKKFVASLKEGRIFYSLSDATVIAVPLTDENENCTAINGVYSAFTATCGIGLLAFADGVSIRAGLDVGVATEIGDGGHEIYGPALERTIYIEKELAEYPRFLVGEKALNYLTWVDNQKYKTKCGEIAKCTARRCRKMIIQDTDGWFMLDFLGESAREALGQKKETFKIAVNSAQNFVKSQYEKYTGNRNDKLSSRYFRLLRYFQSKQSI